MIMISTVSWCHRSKTAARSANSHSAKTVVVRDTSSAFTALLFPALSRCGAGLKYYETTLSTWSFLAILQLPSHGITVSQISTRPGGYKRHSFSRTLFAIGISSLHYFTSSHQSPHWPSQSINHFFAVFLLYTVLFCVSFMCCFGVINDNSRKHQLASVGYSKQQWASCLKYAYELEYWCIEYFIFILWARSFSTRLTSVTFAKDKVLIFLILRKNAKIVQLWV